MMSTLKIPRKVRSQQVKQKIFNAALSLIQEKGYEYVTVSNVCQTAQVSVGSFYHHFGNKDELLSYYFVAGYERYKDASEPPETDDFIEQILYIFGIYIRFCLDQDVRFLKNFYTPANTSLYITMDQVNDETRLPILAKVYGELEKAQQKEQLSQEIDICQLAENLCTLEKGCIFEYALSDGRYPLLEKSREILRTFLQGLRLAPAPLVSDV